ncbi:MAG: Rrf2 family transcriptional regulator [Candidatus Omnitrophica bacterium]|nr:Rrf2 family transcriptional regulator [Candidatus Omnitrophota bacterium]MBU1906076.1 Rrf2 family transcriptional regulator [Candidatus Omnitrophota bacterium]
MRITYRGDYALKTILDLALHHGNSPITIHGLAKRLDIPTKFLEQILLDLKRGGFVESRRGKVGGYLLVREPSEVTLGEVIRYIDGQVEPISCVNKDYRGCKDKNKCALRDVWQQVAEATSQIVDNITFEDLIRKNKELSSALVYQI